MTVYDKLVRDRIPEIIAASGRSCTTEVLNDAAYDLALRAKLVEESREVQDSVSREELLLELADVLEVLDTLLTRHGVDMEEVRTLQAARRAERGGFARRLRLLAIVEASPPA